MPLNQYPHAHSVALQEGKRKVSDEDKPKLPELGKLPASRTTKMIFRSGNAEGADQLFADGVAMVDDKRLQVISMVQVVGRVVLTWLGYRDAPKPARTPSCKPLTATQRDIHLYQK